MEKPAGFSVFSWNVNGLTGISIKDTLKDLKCSILAIQETKISRDQLDERTSIIDDFTSYFSFNSRNRTGYSGVATYCKNDCTPAKSEEGLTNLLYAKYSKYPDDVVGNYCSVEENEKSFAIFGDDDGRSVITQHTVQMPSGEQKLLAVINVYCPRLRVNPEDTINSRKFKETFHSLLGRRAQALMEAGSFVIITGDLNISHKVVDRCEGVETEEFLQNVFRQWMDSLLATDFVDTFRFLHPTATDAFSCWCTRNNARQNNYGSRIDYIIADKHLSEYLEKAEIHADVYGSEHCPISATFHSLITIPSPKPPSGCTKYYPEFIGKQMKLHPFLAKCDNKTKSSATQPPKQNTLKKRNNPTGGKQNNIANILRKKAKLISEVECKSNEIQNNTRIANSSQGKLVTQSDSYVNTTIVIVSLANDKTSFTTSDSCHNTNKDDTTDKELGMSSMSNDIICVKETMEKTTTVKNMGKNLLSSIPNPNAPVCLGHKEPCSLRTVRKKGVNFERKFWACSKGIGRSDDPNGNCNFFLWANHKFPA